MTSERDYRQEAKSTRQAARAQIKELREARLRARMQASGPGQVASQPVSNRSQIDPSDFFSMASASAPDKSPTGVAGPGEDKVAHAPEAVDTRSLDNAAEASLGEETAPNILTPGEEAYADLEHPTEPDQAAQPERAAQPEDPTEPEQAAEPDTFVEAGTPPAPEPYPEVEDAPAEVTDPAPDAGPTAASDIAKVDPDSDLFNLPGAGAGMVWMFHQCGIRTLEDLAEANASDLALQLGVVGHIINMEPWIAFAREGGHTAS